MVALLADCVSNHTTPTPETQTDSVNGRDSGRICDAVNYEDVPEPLGLEISYSHRHGAPAIVVRQLLPS